MSNQQPSFKKWTSELNPKTNEIYAFGEPLEAISVPKKSETRRNDAMEKRTFLWGRYIGVEDKQHKFIGRKILEKSTKLSKNQYNFFIPIKVSAN